MPFHIRLVSPPEETVRLTDALMSEPGVSNLVVLRGSARRPVGDAVQFDVRQGAADAVISQLRGLRLQQHGPIAVEQVDVSIERTARPKGEPQPLIQHDVVPAWEMVEARIRAGASYAPSFFSLLIIAGLIGAVGILTNSQILIVGAMVVGPEYSAIMGVALGLDKRSRALIVPGLFALAAGFAAAIIVTLLFGLIIRETGHTPRPYLAGVQPVADLIGTPNLFSVVVAVLAAVAGIVSLTEARASALIGVFISVTTIPAAAATALAIAYGSWHAAGEALVQLLLNVVLLIVVGAVTLRLQRVFWRLARPGGRQAGGHQPQDADGAR
jgi:uncharacterized hydrophobic protein (TIGR00271 family)